MTKFKRILLITHFFPPHHNLGTENYTLGLGKALQAKGHAVQIICAEDWNFGLNYWNGATKEQYEGLTVHRHHINWSKASDPNQILYDSQQVESWFDQFLHDNPFDIAHVTHTYSLGVGILRSIKRARIPLVLTLTDFWFLCPSLQLLRSDGTLCDGITTAWDCQSCLMASSDLFRRLNQIPTPESLKARVWDTLSHVPIISRQRGLRGLLLDIDHRKTTLRDAFSIPDIVLSPSRVVQSLFAENNLKPIRVVRHGHDLSWLGSNFRKSKSDVVRFGYLGQITKIKGVHVLIEAFYKAKFGEKVQLDIWGDLAKDEEYTKQLRALIHESSPVFLQGRYERSDLAKILSNIDVLVVPSLWYENAPLVIQEALAAKTPVITSNIGGMAEAVFHQENGLLFERGNSDDLSRQLRRIVEEPELLDRLKQHIQPIRDFDDELAELESIYDQKIEELRGTRSDLREHIHE